MKNFTTLLSLILTLLFGTLNAQAEDYISQLANGDLVFEVTYEAPQAYVEVFSQKNGAQNIAQNIVGSEQPNGDGTFTYSLTVSASGYTDGDAVVARFYSYEPGMPGGFIPGPDPSVWTAPYIYGSEPSEPAEVCKSSVIQSGTYTSYVDVLDDGSVMFRLESFNELDYLELFVRRNGEQNIALNVAGAGYPVYGGAFYYDYVTPANYYEEGDELAFRYYLYYGNSGQVFVPGPSSGEWFDQLDWVNYCGSNDAIFVSTGGNDANPGTVDLPVRTIQVGIDLAESLGYSEVRVSHGRYYESEILMKDGVSLLGGYSYDFSERSYDRYHTTIDAYDIGGGYGCYSRRAIAAIDITSPTVLEGFTITGGTHCGYYSPIGGGGLLIIRTNDQFIVRNNRIFENSVLGHSQYTRGGNIFMWQSAAKILNNEIVYGYSPVSGADIWASEGYEGQFAEIAYNTFTSTYTTVVDPQYDFHDNNYLSFKKGAAQTSNEVMNTFESAQVESASPVLIQVYDLKGALLMEVQNKGQINDQLLQPGIYLVVTESTGRISREKIMVH